MQTEGIQRRLTAVINAIVRASRKLAVAAAVFGLLMWIAVRPWFDGVAQVVVLLVCLGPAIAAIVAPYFLRRAHREATALIAWMPGNVRQAREVLPRIDAAVDKLREAKRWGRVTAGRQLLGQLNDVRGIATGVSTRVADVQASGMAAVWATALGFVGLLALVFLLPFFIIAQLLV